MILPSFFAPIAGPLGLAHRTPVGGMRIDLDAARRRRRLARWTATRLAVCAVVFVVTMALSPARGQEPPPPASALVRLVDTVHVWIDRWWGVKPRIKSQRKYIGGDG